MFFATSSIIPILIHFALLICMNINILYFGDYWSQIQINIKLCYFCDINFKFIFINVVDNITAKITVHF